MICAGVMPAGCTPDSAAMAAITRHRSVIVTCESRAAVCHTCQSSSLENVSHEVVPSGLW